MLTRRGRVERLQRPKPRGKPMARRPSALDGVRDEIAAWLAAEPELTGVDGRERLDRRYPGRFATLSQRTIQRAVKAVRATQGPGVLAATAALLNGDPPVNLLDDAEASPTAPPPHRRNPSNHHSPTSRLPVIFAAEAIRGGPCRMSLDTNTGGTNAAGRAWRARRLRPVSAGSFNGVRRGR